MIQPNELRIGNYVAYDDNVTKVTAIESNRLHTKDFSSLNYHEFNPIELTEEWLIKLGLTEEDYESEEYASTTYHSIQINDNRIVVVVSDLGEYQLSLNYGGDFLSNDLLWVHQFQNLIHALTGQELTIKE